MTEPFDLNAELAALGLKGIDLQRLTGTSRQAVSGWRNGRAQVPVYAQTIIRQQKHIRTLSKALSDALTAAA